MNKFLSMLVLLICTNLATMFAQNTTLEVDNQYPGWLSSKIPFKDQASVQNLTVTGYINGTDVKFIRELINNRQLSHLDLSDANIVAGGDEYYIDRNDHSYTIDEDNTIGGGMFCGKLKYLSLPKSITKIETGRYTNFFCNPIDTLIIGGDLKEFRLVDVYQAEKYLEIREGVSSFIGYPSGYGIQARNVHLPSTIKELKTETFNTFWTDTVKVNVENIDYFGNRCIYNSHHGFDIGVLDIDTLTFSQDLSIWNVNAFLLKNGTTIFLNNKLKEINLQFIDEYSNSCSWGGALLAKNLIIHAPSRTPIKIDREDLLTTATVYVPKGCVEAYKNQLPWSNATILEEKVPVTGIKLDKDNISFSKIGETTFLNASILPEDASNKNVTWESSDTKVAIVSKGKVVCTGFGTAVISAVSVNGDFMATCIINATTGIEGINDDASQKVVKRYDITGREISQPVNGINIVKTEDGRVLKISVKRK